MVGAAPYSVWWIPCIPILPARVYLDIWIVFGERPTWKLLTVRIFRRGIMSMFLLRWRQYLGEIIAVTVGVGSMIQSADRVPAQPNHEIIELRRKKFW